MSVMTARDHRYAVTRQKGGSFGVEIASADGVFSTATGFETEAAARAWIKEQLERDRAAREKGDDHEQR
jgi:hypothetical protein